MTLPNPPVSPSENITEDEMTDLQKEEAATFFEELEKEAKLEMRNWMAARVPPAMQKMFAEKFPAPEQPAAPAEAPAA